MVRFLILTAVMAGWWALPAYGCIKRTIAFDKLPDKIRESFIKNEVSHSTVYSDAGRWRDSDGKMGKFASILHTESKGRKSGCFIKYDTEDYRYMLILDDGRKFEFSWTVGDMSFSRRAQTIGKVDEGEFVFSDGDDVSMSISVEELGKAVYERDGRRYSYPQIEYNIAVKIGDYELDLQTYRQRGDVNFGKSSQLKLLPVIEELEGEVKIDHLDSDNVDTKEGFFKKAKRAYVNTLSSVGCLVSGGCTAREDDSIDETSQ